MPDNIQEIKDKLDIVETISLYVNLKKAGVNFQARCPFHNEATPSFIVSPAKQIWRCFGACDEGGDIFKFIMKIEGLEFPEVLKLMADKAGVRLEKQDPRIQSERNRRLDFNERASLYFEKCLATKTEAKKYLRQRGLKEKTIKKFRLGYCPENTKALKMFENRIVFPIRDSAARILGFTARTLEKNPLSAKYINSPDSLLYKKSRVLYGFDSAKSEIRKKDLAILVEGNLDVMMSHQSGIKNAVASSGSAISEEQLLQIKRLTVNLLLAFDADPAGEKATHRALESALNMGFNVKVLSLSQKDPADIVKKDPRLWKQEIKKAQNIMDYFFSLALNKFHSDRIEDKKEISSRLLPWIARIQNPIERSFWLQKLEEQIKIPEEVLREGLPRALLEIENLVKHQKIFNNLEERLAGLLFKYRKNPREEFLKKFVREKNDLLLRLEQEVVEDPEKEIDFLKKRLRLNALKEIQEKLSQEIKTRGKEKGKIKNLLKKFNATSQEIVKLQKN